MFYIPIQQDICTLCSFGIVEEISLMFISILVPNLVYSITGGRSSTSVNGDIAIQWEWSNLTIHRIQTP